MSIQNPSNKETFDVGTLPQWLLQMPMAIAVFSESPFRLEWANDLAVGVLINNKESIGRLLQEATPAGMENTKEIFDNIMLSGIPFQSNEKEITQLVKGISKTGWYNITYQPIRVDNNSITGILATAYDITELVIARKKTEEREFSYYNMVHSSSLMIANFKGVDMIIEIANDAILESWGKGKDIIGLSIFDAMPETVKQGYDHLFMRVFQTGEPYFAYESPITLVRDGKPQLMHYTFVYTAQRNSEGDIIGVSVFANEVSAQVVAKNILIESEERFRSLADNMPLHLFIIEPNEAATINFWNKNWLNYTGQSFAEAIGNTWPGVIHPDDEQPIMDIYVTAFKNRQPYFLPAVRVKRYDGEYRWHAVQANPRYLPNGTYMGYIGVGFDIHEQKLAQDLLKLSEEHFRLMADLMPSKISNADANGNVNYFNKHWLTFSGYTFEELKDYGYQKMMHPDEVAEFQRHFQKAAVSGTDLVMEMRFRNKAGEYIWHLNIASPIRDTNGKLKMWVGVTTEMQHQKHQREELEQAVAERTLALSAANEELKKMNKELEAFTYVSSHDLQEPLRKIQTFAGRILDKEHQNLTESGKNYFHLMRNAAERMQTLIHDLLAFSHLSMADRKFETLDLNIVIEEVKKEFKESIAEKQATIEVEGLCEVKIIPFQFRQLMHNLIGNALKFAKPNVPPHIIIMSRKVKYRKKNVARLPLRKEYCHISIADNGIGFEKEFEEKIFEVFQKLHAKDEYAGTGIGLAIVKKIIENHHGIITATSELHIGTTFDVYLPT